MSDLSGFGFDANEVDPAHDFGPLAVGEYLAAIVDSEVKRNSKDTGSYLELMFQILEGQYQTRRLWTRLNLDNPSKFAVEMARAELSAICRAVGVMKPHDSRELHDIPMSITVTCTKRKDTGELTNEIKGYKKVADGQPRAVTSAAPWDRS